LAEGVDYLADAAAIAASLLTLWLSRRPPTTRRPHGYPNATALAALVNAAWLLVLTLLVSAGSIDRLVRGTHHVDGLPVLIVSAVAAVFMAAGAVILGSDPDDLDNDQDSLAVRAVLLDTAADAAAAGGVAATGAIIVVARGLFWLDPAAALLVSIVVGYHAVRLLRQVSTALR
jgi:cobalt-zinc-cadmium efflux system protein